MDRQKLGGEMIKGKPSKGSNTKLPEKKSEIVAPEKKKIGETLDDSSSLSRLQGVESLHGDAQSHNGAEGAGIPSVQNRVSIGVDFRSKEELSDLKAKLQTELLSVRNLMEKIERCSGKNPLVDNKASGGRLKRVHSEVGSLDVSDAKNRRVVTGTADKIKSTPVVAPFQENSEVTLRGERASVSVQTKKSKANKTTNREEPGSAFGMENSSSKVFKSCSSLLNKLMRSKGGWLFNEPVDMEGLGLDDYFTIVKHPMDLGTVKSRLTTNWYKTPQEFAEDVRLTFQNAMAYNTEGHEINSLAKQFLKIFEDKWVVIEADYLHQLNKTADSAANLPTLAPPPAGTSPPPTAPPLTSPSPARPTDMPKIVDRSEDVLNAAGSEAKSTSLVASRKTRLPKPKAKDPHKRVMTLEEKEKLSASLQNLPPEKLEGVVRIIKKRNPSLSQNDDEIEVDIDTVDTETLWELDRFIIYYKKDSSKMRRSAKLAQIGVVVDPNLHEKNRADCGTIEVKDEADEKHIFSSASNEGEQEGGNTSLSGGSTSDSGSSSRESDTDSSSS